MKSTSTKTKLIVVFALLFVAATNVNSQVKTYQKNKEVIQELRSQKNKEKLTPGSDIRKQNPINLKKETFESKFSPVKIYSGTRNTNALLNILADASDSAYIYDWVEVDNNWDWSLDSRILYYYGANGVEVTQEKKAEGSGEWEKRNKSEYLYYASNELQKLTNSFWKNATQEWIDYELEAYNETGMETEYYYKLWNDTTQKFTDGIRITSTYKKDTLLIKDVLQEWDTLLNTWSFALMVENEFNSRDLITSSVEKIYNKESSQWENSYNTAYEYDGSGDLMSETLQYWDTISDQWANDVYVTRSYNEIGDLTEQLIQVWDATASEWQNNYKRNIAYNNSTLQLESINDQIWDKTTENWRDTTRATYVYTDLGSISTYLEEAWNGTSWGNIYQETYNYNSQGYRTGIEINQWDSENQDWKNYITVYYTYDSEGYLESERYDYWDSTTEQWETGYFDEWTQTGDYFHNDFYTKNWNDTLDKFTGGTRELTTYYLSGLIKEYTLQRWDTTTSSWVNEQKEEYFWNPALPAEYNELEQISIYPTPFNNTLNIELTENINTIEIEIYSIQGQKIDKFYLDKMITTIDLSRLKNGVYFIVYEANNKQFVKKIIKQ